MPVLASQASLIPYRGEGGSASVGEGDMDTPMLGGMELAPLIWDMVIHTTAEAIPHPTGIRIDIHELHSGQDELRAGLADHVEGGEQHAVWTGTCWLGLYVAVCLSLCRCPLSGVAMVGWLERRLGAWAWLALVYTLSVSLVVKLN